MSDAVAAHLVFEEIGRLALAAENDDVSPQVMDAFAEFMVAMPDVAATARAAPTPSERDAILDHALENLRALQKGPVLTA